GLGPRGLGDGAAVGIADERGAEELDARVLRALVAHAVDRADVDAVGDRVRALDRLPRGGLLLAPLLLLARMQADCRGVEEDRRTAQRGEPRRLGIPLVPADERPDASVLRVERLEAEVARGEIELLVIERIVRDVHL